MSATTMPASRSLRASLWPWLILGFAAVMAVWHATDFPDDLDAEFPRVQRPTFSRRPPPAYRLAEPGDTLDRAAIYLAAAAIVLAAAGAWGTRDRFGLWTASLGLSCAALWHASTPGPTFDGWHGMGWREIFDPVAPPLLRIGLAATAIALGLVVVISVLRKRSEWASLIERGRTARILGLLSLAAVLVLLRQFEIPGVEPVGYWPRWSFLLGLLAFDLALLKAIPKPPAPSRIRVATSLGLSSLVWFALVAGGIGLTWYHRPLSRLRTIVPGKIYISAMPTKRGLEVAQGRHHFKTIINLFPEDTPLRSPILPDELQFAKENGIQYVGSPADEESSNQFLDQTLALAQDPNAWPILVHCHGCMDRTPAWMGIYRFIVQGKPLNEILAEIEGHRGYRPKASVTLLYNRVLPPRAPERYAADPTAKLLKECAKGTPDPALQAKGARRRRANQEAVPRVSRRMGPRAQLPNLTPSRRSLEYQKTLSDPHLHKSAPLS
ncbi:protein-tyrosine phosphatase family protein [Singulisphaera acidiphila]|uniref:Protein tyrosine/serine phosphatase n=1 Tax=Singulisphaera acidiphila (strain ATCC BAA-1392 / DSM 18658 / VKM B-2454 / MOB10) TaxID=886293 RepID=L0DD33_SINAD|nr:protein-tyrosine-phosphatase [Singulisphaera acidiphila]AGA26561.1 protein tyrosine/serine phosphatase [Singulisphaera acidiphila DSM 18658]